VTLVTAVHLNGFRDVFSNFRWKLPTLPVSNGELDLDAVTAFIREIRIPYADLWIQNVCSGSIDALVVLLIAQLRNLSHLYLARDFTRQSTLLGMVLRSVLCEAGNHYNLPEFQNLRDVSYVIPDGEDEVRDRKLKSTADILPLFYLPNLERLSASIENQAQFSWPISNKPMPANLKSLELTHVGEKYLGELLSVTLDLRALK
jgi:hypothetical protein